MAANDMLRQPNRMMERLWRKDNFSKDAMEKIADLKNKVLEDFGEALKNPDELKKAQETLAEVAEHVMDTMIIEDGSEVRTLDMRAMRQVTRQLALCAKKADEESYMIPVKTGESVMGVSLKVIRGKKEKGFVDIMFEDERLGKVTASFQAKEGSLSGMIAVDNEDARQLLAGHLDVLTRSLQTADGGKEAVNLNIACVSGLSFARCEMAGINREQKMAENGDLADDSSNQVQTSRLYSIAEIFIQSIQKLQSV